MRRRSNIDSPCKILAHLRNECASPRKPAGYVLVMRIRLQDVAKLANVSEATVSRVMNGRDGVAPGTRAKVLAVLADLGYLPPALRTNSRVGLVGLIVPELTNPIFPAFAQAFVARLMEHGYVSVLCCMAQGTTPEEEYAAILAEHRVDGLIVVSGRNANLAVEHEAYLDLSGEVLPQLFVNGFVEGLGIDAVSTDDAAAVKVAVRHLAELGHECIGLLVGPERYQPVVRKIAGFHAALAELGLVASDRQIVETIYSLEGGAVGAHHLVEAGVTGIVTASDLMALGAIRGLRDAGLDVPSDISVIGFDDSELMGLCDPPLTTLRQPVDAIAELATRLLAKRIADEPTAGEEYLVRPELVLRASTARVRRPAELRS
ncbi:MAG: LacI family DNA-binding transcriptional regulator [Ilumatobacteraceae bacterium]